MSNVDDPDNDTIPDAPIIEAGHACEALVVAFANVAQALGELEATAAAIARALDSTVPHSP
jgi:hypothetical protein